jgi:hypothetical protein
MVATALTSMGSAGSAASESLPGAAIA